jgi:hypothetical protein
VYFASSEKPWDGVAMGPPVGAVVRYSVNPMTTSW